MSVSIPTPWKLFGLRVVPRWSKLISRTVRDCSSVYLRVKASFLRKAFTCDSLQGTARQCVCINSDLAVSCSYRDLDGAGRIGNLHEHSLRECLCGPTAESFRETLAKAQLPTANCSRCVHLRMVGKRELDVDPQGVMLPSAVMVENTSACNLHCVSCAREIVRRTRMNRSMSLADVRTVAKQLSDIDVREITYHHLGEPFLSTNILEEVGIIREYNPGVWITVSTNGMRVKSAVQRTAALLFDCIQVSLDGISTTMASRYQRGIDFDTVYQNIRDLVAYRDAMQSRRPRIIWKYLLFRWNERRRYLFTAIDMAREAGVDEIWFERTVSPACDLPWRTYTGFNRDLVGSNGSIRRHVLRGDSA